MKNFGKIKNSFNELMVESIIKKDNVKKDLFKSYLKSIKENEILKTQFLVYTNFENKVESNEAKVIEYVKENIALFDKFKKKEILDANIKLASSINEKLVLDKYDNEILHENISKLIFTKKTASNLDLVIEAQDAIVKSILNNKAKSINEQIDLPLSMVSNIIVQKYNEKYDSLTENEKKVLMSIIDSDTTQKKEIYSTTLRECIDLININLVEADVETKGKLLNVKDKLLNDNQEINETFINKISKLIELQDSLKNN